MKIIGKAIGRRWFSRPIPGFWQYRALELTGVYFGYRVLSRIYDSPKFLDGKLKNDFEPWLSEKLGVCFDKSIYSFERFWGWMTQNSQLSLFLLILDFEFENKFKELGNQYPNLLGYVTIFQAAIRTQSLYVFGV